MGLSTTPGHIEADEIQKTPYQWFRDTLKKNYPQIRHDIAPRFAITQGHKQAAISEGIDPKDIEDSKRKSILRGIASRTDEYIFTGVDKDGKQFRYGLMTANATIYIHDYSRPKEGIKKYADIQRKPGFDNEYVLYTHYDDLSKNPENYKTTSVMQQYKRQIILPECLDIIHLTHGGALLDQYGNELYRYTDGMGKPIYVHLSNTTGDFYVFEGGVESHPTKATQENGLLMKINNAMYFMTRRI